MTKFVKDKPPKLFVSVSEELARDSRLSWKARGVFLYLWSNSNSWDYYIQEVAKHATDGVASLRSGVKELERYGYLERSRARENGRLKGTKWVIHYVSKANRPTKHQIKGSYRQNSNHTYMRKPYVRKSYVGKSNTNYNQPELRSTRTRNAENPESFDRIYKEIISVFPQLRNKGKLTDLMRNISTWLSNYSIKQINDVIRYADNYTKHYNHISKPIGFLRFRFRKINSNANRKPKLNEDNDPNAAKLMANNDKVQRENEREALKMLKAKRRV